MEITIFIISAMPVGKLCGAGLRSNRHRRNDCLPSFEFFIDNGSHHLGCLACRDRRKYGNFFVPIERPLDTGIESHRTYEMRFYHDAAIGQRAERTAIAKVADQAIND